ncbi:MAG TPA: HAMP domain-containing sensor histidine kinase [Caulobacteraceae bacterium]|jgi:signal transduction histidine kinase
MGSRAAEPALSTEPAAAPSAEDSRRAFMRMMSHELRTPLNSIIGFSEILASELYGPIGRPQYKEYAELVRISGLRLLTLVNQALEISRLEGGAAEFDIQAESLDHPLDDALVEVAEEARARYVRIDFDPPAEPPVARIDVRGLRTAVVNLLQNAIAFSPEGGEVRLSLTAEDGRAVVRVTDTGPGLDPAEVPRLLRPFEQGENALVRRCGGAGLGWPIVRLLCKAMGAEFWIDTDPGKGLTARISLPLA